MTSVLHDVKIAVRGLLRSPAFTLISVMTLALGIGANTAVFTLVDGVLLSPLPFDEPDELISINHLGRDGQDQLPISSGLYQLYRDEARSIESIGMFVGTGVTLVADGDPQRVQVQAVTPGFFELLGWEAARGRTFADSEGLPGGELTVILSDGMWRTDFGADPDILGRSLDINGTLREVVGVMEPGPGYPDQSARMWLPMVVDPANAPLAAFGASGIARAADGHTAETVTTELEGILTRLDEFFPESGAVPFLREVGLETNVRPLKEALVGDLSSALWIILGTVGLVLLIACANVANLLIVRAEGRQREFALRLAVGAGRVQVLRSFLSESLVLAGAGGILGVAIAWLAVRTSLGFVPSDIPRMAEVGIDLRVLAFSGAMVLICAVVFGALPLFRFGTEDLADQLREGDARANTAGAAKHRLRSGLVIAQLALAQVLLVGSGLMIRSFQALRDLDPGYTTERVLTARLTVPTAEAGSWDEAAGFFRQLRERLRGQPGIEEVGFAQAAPLGGGIGYFSIEVEDEPRGPEELPVFASNNQVEVGYMEAIGLELLDGRTFQVGDGAEGARSVVVSRTFAEHWWPNASPVGRRMRLGFPEEDWYTIVGVVGDAHYTDLEGVAEEMVYWPATVGPAEAPQATRAMDVTIRTSADPLMALPILRREVAALNGRIPVSNPQTMEARFKAATARRSFTMSLLGAASGIALLLGLVGIYGVISYVVSQRTREIGIRMALGAEAPSVRAMVVRQGMTIAGIGVVLGLVASGAMSRVMASLLFGVSATDPATYISVALALIVVSLGACWIPAVRAAGVNPALALRAE